MGSNSAHRVVTRKGVEFDESLSPLVARRQDLDEIADYLGRSESLAAVRVLEALVDRIDMLAEIRSWAKSELTCPVAPVVSVRETT